MLGQTDDYINEETRQRMSYIGNTFGEDATLIRKCLRELCNDIFKHDDDLEDIDFTIRTVDDYLYVVLTNEGILYNPYSNENIMKSDNFTELTKLNCKFDYDEILGFNKTYIIFQK